MAPEMGTMVFGRMAASSSMEAAEPKTLTLKELNYARAALYVLRTSTAEEAIRIFTDGLKPVRGIRESSSATMTDSSSDDDVELDSPENYPTARPRCGRHGRRRSVKRDVATAPF